METKISVQIKKLIELDHQAVELGKQREKELKDMEQVHKKEMDCINSSLQQAKGEAKDIYSQIVQKAQREAQALEDEAKQRLQRIDRSVTQAISGLEEELWGKILGSIE